MNRLRSFIAKNFQLFLIKKKFPSAFICNEVTVDRLSRLDEYVALFDGVKVQNSKIRKFSYVQKNSNITNSDIGPFCSIGPDVSIGLINHPTMFVSTSPVFYDASQPLPYFFTDQTLFDGSGADVTFIGADVWIGHGAKVIAGVSVGVGAIIAAGAVVANNVEPYSVVGGVPARHIRFRFETNVIEGLLNSKWWEFSEKKLKFLAPYFMEPKTLISKLVNDSSSIN
jgi:acetyltransferase-like isoleucine patch superfamily enzyme